MEGGGVSCRNMLQLFVKVTGSFIRFPEGDGQSSVSQHALQSWSAAVQVICTILSDRTPENTVVL